MHPSATDIALELRQANVAIAAQVESAMQADLAAVLNGCDPLLIEVIHYALFNGGKRIRPLLTVLSSRCCGRDDRDLYLLAAAFEYLHVATLIHDDVIDNAAQRRGKDTVGSRYGLTAAILTGDWLHARSMHLIGRLAGPEGLEIFCQATASMVNGEFEQLRLIGDVNAPAGQYFQIIRQKTGNLIASTCMLGALFAGAEQSQRQALATYGDSIGAAFQVVDDLLDFQGEAVATGKKTGNDFVEGKITLPLLQALERANPEDQQNMAALLQGDRTQPEAYRQLVALIERYDGFEAARAMARQLVETAVAALQPLSHGADTTSVRLLQALALYVLTRSK